MKASGVCEIDWEVEPSRAGPPTLRLGGRQVHSLYAPRREARDQAERALAEIRKRRADFVVLVGLGLGYLPEALCERWRGTILVWDPFPETSRALPLPPGAWTRRTHRFETEEQIEAALRPRLRRGERPFVWAHPGYTEMCRYELRRLARLLHAAQKRAEKLDAGRAVVSERSLDALVRFPYRRSLAELAQACAGQTVVVAAPGPSLEEALEPLARRRGGVVFAALQALRPLVRAGVRVDFVVAPDPIESRRHLEGVDARFGVLLAESAVEPELLDRWPERTALFQIRSAQLHQVAWERCRLPVLDELLMTASETAFVLAQRLGARRLALAGVDLCGEADRYRGFRLQSRDLRGEPVVTNCHYLHAARTLGALCLPLAQQGAPVLRLGRGLPVRGARAATAAELGKLLDAAPRFEPLPPARAAFPERRKVVLDLLRPLAEGHATTSVASDGVGEGRRWAAFRPLEPARLQHAGRDALRALERAAPGG